MALGHRIESCKSPPTTCCQAFIWPERRAIGVNPCFTCGSFLANHFETRRMPSQSSIYRLRMYDLTLLLGSGGEAEDLGEFFMGVNFLGEHVPELGPAAGGRGEYHCFQDAGQLLQEFAYGMVVTHLFGFMACRWAICKSTTQVKVWMQMSCSVSG